MATSSSGGAAVTVETSQTPSAAIDSDRWPAVAKVPRGPLAAASAAIANRLLRRTATHLPLRLVYSDGTATGAADPRAPSLFIHRPDALARRIGRHGLIGFGESYMAGEWSSKELTRVLTVLAGSVDELVPRSLHWLRPITPTFRPSWPDHSRDQARRNIAVHYDLSNDLFAAFLDETMTYSCAMFTDLLAQPTPAWTELAAAQRRKIDRLLDVAGVQQGSHVLEIGTGWGELCIRAAARGAHIRSVTLSVEQQRLARQRVAAAGFGHRVEIDLCDYRDVDGQYDSVVSVEMIEAVGYRSWPRYFAALEQLVRPGGPVAIQAITMPHHRMLATRHTQTWIQKYIFPGGLLPSTQAIIDITGQHTGLRIVDAASLRPHYAETLRLWRERFMQRRDGLAHLGFDEVFARMWELYLAYSEAGFRSGYLDVYQWTLIREGPP
ncbi:cyclopropane-fatty-acyl-phospholipid synthase [Mycobacterium tuberculosis]|nr:cyclopropane-fatty-acyl-phospholipid synthase [Mycobacterium tuberculosis]